jgi:hypothetical protein
METNDDLVVGSYNINQLAFIKLEGEVGVSVLSLIQYPLDN